MVRPPGEGRTLVTYVMPVWMPFRIRRAAVAAGFPSSVSYVLFRLMQAIGEDVPEYDVGEMVDQIPRRTVLFPGSATSRPYDDGLAEKIRAVKEGR